MNNTYRNRMNSVQIANRFYRSENNELMCTFQNKKYFSDYHNQLLKDSSNHFEPLKLKPTLYSTNLDTLRHLDEVTFILIE